MKVLHVVGARPNFVKAAPVIEALKKDHTQVLVHTGQHYDNNMSDVFWSELGLPKLDERLTVGVAASTNSGQIAATMQQLESPLELHKPDWVFVYGDVNSTAGAALAAKHCGFKVAHVESGLRSFDRTMPEEINRVVTDHVADLLFCSCQSGVDNLMREGISADQVHFVGNTMIDTLNKRLPTILKRKVVKMAPKTYGVVTLHRPSNVDDLNRFRAILEKLFELSLHYPIMFVSHPRTARAIDKIGWNMKPMPPLGYFDFTALIASAGFVITDSGGVQEETTWLNVPCMTLRNNTERPITVDHGTNALVSLDQIDEFARIAMTEKWRKKKSLPFWDGLASERIAKVMKKLCK